MNMPTTCASCSDLIPGLSIVGSTRVWEAGRAARPGTRSRPMCWACLTSPCAGASSRLGAALVAGYAVGAIPDLVEAASRASEPDGKPVAPDMERHACYIPLARQYAAWQDALQQGYQRYLEVQLG